MIEEIPRTIFSKVLIENLVLSVLVSYLSHMVIYVLALNVIPSYIGLIIVLMAMESILALVILFVEISDIFYIKHLTSSNN